LIGLLAERLVFPLTAKVICVSDYDLQLAKRAGFKPAKKMVVVPNGIEVGDTVFLEDKFRTSPIRIVFVGRLDKQKAPEQLIRAFAQLPDKTKVKAEVVMAGGGPKMSALEKLIADRDLHSRVKLLGNVPREEVWCLLRSSHIFVLPSNWEGLPLTILEAMASSMAVVASDVGGVKETIGGGAGVLIKRGDQKALCNTLEDLIAHPEKTEELARTAFAKVKKDFGLERMLASTLQVYRSVLE
jgi:glycosyltransferase involved in cell wall biosynthesis